MGVASYASEKYKILFLQLNLHLQKKNIYLIIQGISIYIHIFYISKC